MWGKAKDLLLLLSLAINVPFILMWAAANTPKLQASVSSDTSPRESAPPGPSRGSANTSTPRSQMPRTFSPPRPEGTRSVYREVGVTEEQWHEIEPRLAQFRTAMFRLSCEMKRQRDELVDLVAAPEIDYEAIRAKQEEILEAHRRTGDLVTENMLEDRMVLTPEQQAKFFKKLRDFCGPSSSSMPSRSPTKHGPVFGTPKRSD